MLIIVDLARIIVSLLHLILCSLGKYFFQSKKGNKRQMIGEICQLIGKRHGVWCDSDTRGEEGFLSGIIANG